MKTDHVTMVKNIARFNTFLTIFLLFISAFILIIF